MKKQSNPEPPSSGRPKSPPAPPSATSKSKLEDEIKRLEKEIKKLKFMVDEGLNWEDLQEDSVNGNLDL